MSLGLPESGLTVCQITLSSLYINLIEACIDRNAFNVPCLPKSLHSSVEVLTNRVSACVPEANAFGKRIAKRVVREREGDVSIG